MLSRVVHHGALWRCTSTEANSQPQASICVTVYATASSSHTSVGWFLTELRATISLLPHQIYQSSVAYGPHAKQTSGGYYHLGKAFLRENKPDIAISLHDQVSCVCGREGGREEGSIGGRNEVKNGKEEGKKGVDGEEGGEIEGEDGIADQSTTHAVASNLTFTEYQPLCWRGYMHNLHVFHIWQVVAIWHAHLSVLVQALHQAYTSTPVSRHTRLPSTDGTRRVASPHTLGMSLSITTFSSAAYCLFNDRDHTQCCSSSDTC